jgi:hypothetical protein
VTERPPRARVPMSTMLDGPEDGSLTRRPARHRAPGLAVVGGLLPVRVASVDLAAALRAARRPGGAEPASGENVCM